MKAIVSFLFLFLAIVQNNYGQTLPKGNFEFDFLGSEFVDRTSFGLSFGVNTNWHERFRGGINFQLANNRNPNDFGYQIQRPNYNALGVSFTNTAHLFSLGRFSLDANANFGWLFLSLQDRDSYEYNPVTDIATYTEVANESFRLLQGGFTVNFLVAEGNTMNSYIYARALKNQAFGNVRFGGESGNSNFQFAVGLRLSFF